MTTSETTTGTSPTSSPAKRQRPITARERRYVEGRVAGKTKRQSALDAGYSESVAENTKQKIDCKPAVQDYLEACFDQQGLSLRALKEKARQRWAR